MGRKCFVTHCKTGYDSVKLKGLDTTVVNKQKISLFKAPSDADSLAKWQRCIPRNDKILSNKDNVCELHFSPHLVVKEWTATYNGNTIMQISTRAKLVVGAIPTIFPTCPGYLSNPTRRKPVKENRESTSDASNLRFCQPDYHSSSSETMKNDTSSHCLESETIKSGYDDIIGSEEPCTPNLEIKNEDSRLRVLFHQNTKIDVQPGCQWYISVEEKNPGELCNKSDPTQSEANQYILPDVIGEISIKSEPIEVDNNLSCGTSTSTTDVKEGLNSDSYLAGQEFGTKSVDKETKTEIFCQNFNIEIQPEYQQHKLQKLLTKSGDIQSEAEQFILPDVIGKVVIKTERKEDEFIFEVENNLTSVTSTFISKNKEDMNSDLCPIFNESGSQFMATENIGENLCQHSLNQLPASCLIDQTLDHKSVASNDSTCTDQEKDDSYSTVSEDNNGGMAASDTSIHSADMPKLHTDLRIFPTEKQHEIDVCSSTSSHGRDLHLGNHITEKPHKCNICSKSFTRTGSLKRHMRIHIGIKPYICTICSKSFSKVEEKKRHMRTHIEEKPYNCNTCSKSFIRKAELKSHIRIHTGEKPHNCNLCSKSFVSKVPLKIHMRTHTGEKPYDCSFCLKSFSVTGDLNNHMRTHTGEKPHNCTICSKSFSRKETLKEHVKIHTGEKPHNCNICSKSFRKKDQLKYHMRTHTGVKPYHCNFCFKSFFRKGCLKKHCMRTHIEEI